MIRVDGARQWIAFDGDRITAAEMISAVSKRARVRDLAVKEPEIEDVVRKLYGGVSPSGLMRRT